MVISKINFNSRELITTPAFCAKPTNDQSNIAEGSLVDIVFDTERFDQNTDFASNTFTAPVTGKYLLNTAIRFHEIDSAAAYIYIYIATSNSNYQNLHSTNQYNGDLSYHTLTCSVVADMDASDTAKVKVYIENSGTVQVDVDNGGSHFSGCLLA